jgi:hypothetical protein
MLATCFKIAREIVIERSKNVVLGVENDSHVLSRRDVMIAQG